MRQETLLAGLSLPGLLSAVATFAHYGNQFKPYWRVII
jgi:hypothetical protein